MNKEEMSHQIALDFLEVKRYTDIHSMVLKDRITRKKEKHICETYRTKNGNDWTWMIDYDGKHNANMTFFTTISTTMGRFVFKPQPTERGFIILVFMPHFFKRYRQRMKLGRKLTPMQLIRRYLRRNTNGVHEYREKGRIEFHSADGVGLGNIISLRMRLLRTFITREMAYGEQEERFAENEQSRIEQVESMPKFSDEVQAELREFGLSEKDLAEKWKELETTSKEQEHGDSRNFS